MKSNLNRLLQSCAAQWRETAARRMRRAAGRKWTREAAEDRLRYDYDLSPSSLVLDCGAYEGSFAGKIAARYDCEVWCFEPVRAYYESLCSRFPQNPKVRCFNQGVGARERWAEIQVNAAASSELRDAGAGGTETVRIADISDVLRSLGRARVELIKINTEGAEYELLEAILTRGLAGRFQNLQIQFHSGIDNYLSRWAAIRRGLSQTHALTYDYYFVWENWAVFDHTRSSP
jgi:FkbM family methyltransferase